MLVRYLLAGLSVFEDCAAPPRVGDEVALQLGRGDAAVYRVTRVVWHRPLCPPDTVNVHLVLAEPEALRWPPR